MTWKSLLANRRLWAVTLVLAAQLSFPALFEVSEQIPLPPNLEDLAAGTASWQANSSMTLDSEVAEALRPAAHLYRAYRPRTGEGPVGLFVAYFTSQRNGAAPHSPKVCLPGSGWREQRASVVQIGVSTRPEPIPVNEYILDRGDERMLVLYWYQNSRRVWATEITAKIYMLPDVLRHGRSDSSLVRVTIPFEKGQTTAAVQRGTGFIQEIFPELDRKLSASAI